MASGWRYDAVVIGSGPGGRGCASRLCDAGMTVAMVEAELVGGECPFWACIPSKTLLRAPEVVSEAGHTAGLSQPDARWREISEYRDYMNSGLDDTKKFERYSKLGIEIVRGRGQIAGPGVVEVGGRRLETERIIVATGTDAAVPEIDGIDEVEFWTNREATSFHEVPGSTIVLGGGPVGIELGQMLSRYGSAVTIVENSAGLLTREAEPVGARLARLLGEEGIDVRAGVRARAVEPSPAGVRVHLDDGAALEAERLLVATGRRPRVDGIGLELAGVEYDEEGIRIDERCRAGEGVWAVGDVTGIAAFTHVAAYQARIVTADIQGREVRADYRAIPRVVFSDPEIAAVGLTPAQAQAAGVKCAEAHVDIKEVDRTETYGRGLEGELGILADAERGVLIGAWAIGPLVSEWIHAAVIAVKAEVTVAVLRDTIVQFPTFTEALQLAVDRLEL